MTASGVAVREERTADAPGVGSVVSTSFGEEEGARILDVLAALRAAGDLCTGLVALVPDDEVVGYVALSRAWLDARRRLVDVLVLSPLGVAPAHQSRGVGTLLLEAAEAAAERAGVPLVFLEGDPTYYSARGWEPAAAHGLVRPSARIPEAACQVRLLSSHEPWMRGALVYPDAWWRQDLVGLRDPLLAELEG